MPAVRDVFHRASQAGGNWPPHPTHLNLYQAVPVTLVLIASSFTCQMGVFAAERGDVFACAAGMWSRS
ncbi:cytochrome c oxidase subunit 3 [Mycobacterium xenopi 4042]|uniref:Cytochrome c oxidase subunit 3 n=1 Tax=Mycobacterium xenopi 4042 TaxID=1299334 RepID=X7ZWE3_MYCXE|nr:cytochrome c oxidase subunit 3 [Mycobacterium xenopi 4042]